MYSRSKKCKPRLTVQRLPFMIPQMSMTHTIPNVDYCMNVDSRMSKQTLKSRGCFSGASTVVTHHHSFVHLVSSITHDCSWAAWRIHIGISNTMPSSNGYRNHHMILVCRIISSKADHILRINIINRCLSRYITSNSNEFRMTMLNHPTGLQLVLVGVETT